MNRTLPGSRQALNKMEFEKLVQEATSLFWYFDKVLFEELPSVLTQVIGLFTVSATNTKKTANHKDYKGYYVVQKNIRFSLRNMDHDVFDLKGVGKQRRMETAMASDEDASPRLASRVFWDQNFREWTNGRPLCLVKEDLRYLEAAMFFGDKNCVCFFLFYRAVILVILYRYQSLSYHVT